MKRWCHWIMLGFSIAFGDDSALLKLDQTASTPAASKETLVSHVETFENTYENTYTVTPPSNGEEVVPSKVVWRKQDGVVRVKIVQEDGTSSPTIFRKIEFSDSSSTDAPVVAPTWPKDFALSLFRQTLPAPEPAPHARKVALIKSPHGGNDCGNGS